MLKLTIDNSVCAIEGLSGAHLNNLADLMSIKEASFGVHTVRPRDASRLMVRGSQLCFRDERGVPCPVFTRRHVALKTIEEGEKYAREGKAIFRGNWHRSRALIDRHGRFPTGLLYLCTHYLVAQRLTVQVQDRRIRPRTPGLPFVTSPGHPARPEQQIAALKAAAVGRGIIVAPTGLGKSRIIAEIITRLGVKTLIVVPTLALKRQLTDDLLRLFGHTALIRVENVDALDPKKPAGVDCVIVDEFHHSGAKTYRTLNKHAWAGVYFKFGLTATPFRSQDHERLLLESVLSKVIYQVHYATAVEAGYITPVEAYYIDLPAVDVNGATWKTVYKELVVEREDRNQLLALLMARLHSQGKSALCLVKEIAHGRAVADLTGLELATGEDGNSEQLLRAFNEGGTALIGTTGVLGEGVDTRPCEYVIIAGLGKSKNAFMQAVGRGFRLWPGKESCKVILVRDPSHKWTLEHFKAQVKYLAEEYGVKPVKLTI